jgi:hypothetical protein
VLVCYIGLELILKIPIQLQKTDMSMDIQWRVWRQRIVMDRLRQSGPFLRRKLDFLPDGGILCQLPARSLAMEYIPTNTFGINWINRFLLSVMGEEKSANLNKMLWTVFYSYTIKRAIKELKIYIKSHFLI